MLNRPVSVIELAGFRRRADDLLTREEQTALVDLIAYEPTCGDVIPGRKKMTRRKTSRLADDIRASLHEAIDFAAGKRTGAVVHKVSPRATAAREARMQLGLSQQEFAAFIGTGVGTVRKWELGTRQPSGPARTLIELIKTDPNAVRRALAKRSSAA